MVAKMPKVEIGKWQRKTNTEKWLLQGSLTDPSLISNPTPPPGPAIDRKSTTTPVLRSDEEWGDKWMWCLQIALPGLPPPNYSSKMAPANGARHRPIRRKWPQQTLREDQGEWERAALSEEGSGISRPFNRNSEQTTRAPHTWRVYGCLYARKYEPTHLHAHPHTHTKAYTFLCFSDYCCISDNIVPTEETSTQANWGLSPT